jgi:hypothetical protein
MLAARLFVNKLFLLRSSTLYETAALLLPLQLHNGTAVQLSTARCPTFFRVRDF